MKEEEDGSIGGGRGGGASLDISRHHSNSNQSFDRTFRMTNGGGALVSAVLSCALRECTSII